ncbi:MAG: CinA family nicotinamide mononucleotide deamidase-related protein [Planctomycetaceae bacterium]|jgi:nicotinamide-nucleotide amidase|nr:CinA family nicotinamide mononucleotide deamidase-related protein [Planctomycetaceae bacterium]
MQAEIISNGDELVSGKILDTNSQWLSLELDDLGVEPLYHTTVGDDLPAMTAVLKIAMQRCDVIIWTGGLGPTADDLTRQAAADAAGVPLEKDAGSLRLIQEMFKRRGRDMPKSNEIQAFQPKGAKPIFNPHGTAPGIDLSLTDKRCKRFLAYPGVPAEMKEMWQLSGRQTVWECVQQHGNGKQFIRFRSIHSFGLGESQVEEMLPGIIDRSRIPKVGITASQGTITLRIASAADTEAECFAKMQPMADWIYKTLGNYIFGENEDTLPSVVMQKLQRTKKTIAVAEAGTRGLLAERLASVNEAGQKELLLGGVTFPPHQAVALEEMVKIARRIFDPDYFLVIGNYPPPKQPGETFAAVIDNRSAGGQTDSFAKSVLSIQKYPFGGHPNVIDDLYIKRVLDNFRKLSIPAP